MGAKMIRFKGIIPSAVQIDSPAQYVGAKCRATAIDCGCYSARRFDADRRTNPLMDFDTGGRVGVVTEPLLSQSRASGITALGSSRQFRSGGIDGAHNRGRRQRVSAFPASRKSRSPSGSAPGAAIKSMRSCSVTVSRSCSGMSCGRRCRWDTEHGVNSRERSAHSHKGPSGACGTRLLQLCADLGMGVV